MKLKYNENTDLWNLKGLTYDQLLVIGKILNFVRFDTTGDCYKGAAFELSKFLGEYFFEGWTEVEDMEFGFSYSEDEGHAIEISEVPVDPPSELEFSELT